MYRGFLKWSEVGEAGCFQVNEHGISRSTGAGPCRDPPVVRSMLTTHAKPPASEPNRKDHVGEQRKGYVVYTSTTGKREAGYTFSLEIITLKF